MKHLIHTFFIAATAMLAACGNTADNATTTGRPATALPIKPGTIVAADSMHINNDSIINLTYKIEVAADSEVDKGVYNVIVDFGPNNAVTSFTLPKGGENATPVLRRGGDPYEYVIGFRLPGDTTFYEYYQVRANKHTTRMDYLKAYTF